MCSILCKICRFIQERIRGKNCRVMYTKVPHNINDDVVTNHHLFDTIEHEEQTNHLIEEEKQEKHSNDEHINRCVISP